MMSHFSIHHWKRWLPVVVLLMILAQLASAAHWHQDEEPWIDCSLCLQSSAADDNHSAPQSTYEDGRHRVSAPQTIISQQPTRLSLSAAIRAPPAASIVKTISP
tara:strand:- start:2231 stop:2542 length:312 start_codon:yes stop_codon:yes gene_type:complete